MKIYISCSTHGDRFIHGWALCKKGGWGEVWEISVSSVRQIHTSVNPLGCLAVWVIAVQFNGSNNYVCNWDTMIVYVWHHIHSGLHQLGRDYGKLCNCFLRGAKRLSYLFSLSIFFFFFLSSSLPVSLLPSVLSFLLPSFSSSFNYTPSLLNPEV